MPCGLRDLFPCFCREQDAISAGLAERKKQLQKTIYILLLGTAECGKSTVLKQMERKYNATAFEEQRRVCSKVAKLNLIMATWQLLDARDNLGFQPDDLEKESRFKDVAEFASPENCNERVPPKSYHEDHAFQLYPGIAEEIKDIWRQPSVRETLDRKAEFYLLDSAEYFMSRIDDVKQREYKPTDEDVLKSRKQTTGIVDVLIDAKLAHDSVIFQITDVGGQRAESKFWFRVMQGVEMTSILYIFSLSDYNLPVLELLPNKWLNRLLENMKMFNTVINREDMRNKNIIVFLNKTDIFEEKLRHVPLTVCYPDYPADNRDPHAAMDFIEQQIRSQDRTSSQFNTGGSDRGTDMGSSREIVFHRTHATDPYQFQTVVDSVLATIQSENLRISGLL